MTMGVGSRSARGGLQAAPGHHHERSEGIAREYSLVDVHDRLNHADHWTVAAWLSDWHPAILSRMLLAVAEAKKRRYLGYHPHYERASRQIAAQHYDKAMAQALQNVAYFAEHPGEVGGPEAALQRIALTAHNALPTEE